jgi:hypothetical protein
MNSNEEVKSFDFRTHLKDPKTGDLIKEQNYVMIVNKTEGTLYERPIGTGNFYNGAGDLIKKGKDPVVEKTIIEKSKEVETENEKLKAQIAELQKLLPVESDPIIESKPSFSGGIGKGTTK